jgi:hypothetical protein
MRCTASWTVTAKLYHAGKVDVHGDRSIYRYVDYGVDISNRSVQRYID